MRLTAAAKINLSLTVSGRRADGYHTLESLVAFTAAGDELVCEKAEHTSLHLTGPFGKALADAPDDDNLIMRALRVLEKETGRDLPSAIQLTKNLPIASGIGGGSADAAAALRALTACHEVTISEARLTALAAQLGADVPVCLSTQAAWMTGIGHDINRLPALPEADIVLVNPVHAVATAAVFQAANINYEASNIAAAPSGFADLTDMCAWLAARGNDLQEAAVSIAPIITDCLAALAHDKTLYAAMSGSGATCFALCSPGDGAAVAAAYQQMRPDDWVMPTQLIS